MIYFQHPDGLLLKQALEPLMDLATEATVTYTPHGIFVMASQEHGGVSAVLRLDCPKLDFFFCNEHQSRNINLRELLMKLGIARNGDSTRVAAAKEKNMIHFLIVRPGYGNVGFSKMQLTEANHEPANKYAYCKYEVEACLSARHSISSLRCCRSLSSDPFITITKHGLNINPAADFNEKNVKLKVLRKITRTSSIFLVQAYLPLLRRCDCQIG